MHWNVENQKFTMKNTNQVTHYFLSTKCTPRAGIDQNQGLSALCSHSTMQAVSPKVCWC